MTRVSGASLRCKRKTHGRGPASQVEQSSDESNEEKQRCAQKKWRFYGVLKLGPPKADSNHADFQTTGPTG